MATTPPPYNPQHDPQWQHRAAREQARAQRDAWREYGRAQRQQWRSYQRSVTRTSYVGPLLLITVGVIFLLIHLGKLSAPVFFGWYGRWWPVLLIVIGLLRLSEWMWARSNAEEGKPAPRYTLGAVAGLALFLLILLGFGATAITHANNKLFNFSFNGDNWDRLAGTKHEADPAPIVAALPAGSTLYIENPHGEVNVTGLSDDGQLHVQAHQEIYVRSDSAAEEALRGLNPELSSSNNNFTLKVPARHTGNVDLTIEVPSGTAVTVNCDRGDVHVGNIKSAVKVTANHGDLDVKAVTGNVQARINHRDASLSIFNVTGAVSIEGRGDELSVGEVNGPVTVKGDFFGGGHLQHVRGAVDLNTGKIALKLARLDGEINLDEKDEVKIEEAVGPLLVKTQKRNVSVTRVTGEVDVTSSYGDVNIASVLPLGKIKVSNHNGEVEVSLPSKAAFTLQADTSDGEVRSDFSLANKTEENAGILSGTVNGGGAGVVISTTRGDISIRRADLPALPPLPKAPVVSPVPPMPAMTGDAKQALREAQQQLKQAQEEMKRAQADAERETKQALAEAKREREQQQRDRAQEQRERNRERAQEQRDRDRDRQ